MALLTAETRAEVARALVLQSLFGTRYSEAPLHALERALAEDSAEYQLRFEMRGEQVGAVALFGSIAGTVGTARLLLVAPSAAPEASLAIEGVVRTLSESGHHLLIAEIPDDPPFAAMRKLLLESGFHEESRIPDFYRGGIAQTFLSIVIPTLDSLLRDGSRG